MAGSYKVDFKSLKQRVGIDDVAYSLGYRLDKRAGVGRYVELVLGDQHSRRDTIVICNHRNKEAQTYFRRDGGAGDVITFIRENLSSFNVAGRSEWAKIANVLAKFANMPEVSCEDKVYTRKTASQTEFDINRFEIKRVSADTLPYLFAKRGFNLDTLNAFKEHICFIKDKMNDRFNGYNIGFPYSRSADGNIEGFEIRGATGFKGKAAGTNSNSAAWLADIKGGRESVDHLYFFESAFDAMAFYQINKPRISHQNMAFVSLGGTFSDMQVKNAIKQFPNATLHDCFDNDLMGRIYGIRLAAIADRKDLTIVKSPHSYSLKFKDKEFVIPDDKLNLTEYYRISGGSYIVKNSKAPQSYKDWNDFVLGRKSDVSIPVSKYERDRNLSELRAAGRKV